MSEQNSRSEQERIRSGQSASRGANGDGRTGVPAGEQGISNRPGDAEAALDDGDAGEAQDREALTGGPRQQKRERRVDWG